MGRPKEYDYDIPTIKKAIADSGGIIATIAERLGCEWHTAKSYIEKYEETKSAYEAESESVIDLAESKLIENIQANDNTAILFYLKTKGKKRGYIERNEIEHSSNGTIGMPVFVFKNLNETE
mgnify:CR=1 FL=1